MKRTRKIFALLLSICMIVTMLPTVAFAADTNNETQAASWEIVESGFIADAAAATEKCGFACKENTMYVKLSAAPADGEFLWFDIKYESGEQAVTYGLAGKGDGKSTLFAWSFNNKAQFEAWPKSNGSNDVAEGINNIKGPCAVTAYKLNVGNLDSITDRPNEGQLTKVAEVTIDTSLTQIQASDVILANLGDNQDSEQIPSNELITKPADSDIITAKSIGQDTYNVTIKGSELKYHTNGNSQAGYWVGFGIKVPAGVSAAKVKFATSNTPFSTTPTLSPNNIDGSLDKGINGTDDGFAYYLDAEKIKTSYLALQFFDSDDKAVTPITYFTITNQVTTDSIKIDNVGFTYDKDIAVVGDCDIETIWTKFTKKLGYGHYILVVKGPDNKEYVQFATSGAEGSKYQNSDKVAWSYNNNTQTDGNGAPAGEYTISLYTYTGVVNSATEALEKVGTAKLLDSKKLAVADLDKTEVTVNEAKGDAEKSSAIVAITDVEKNDTQQTITLTGSAANLSANEDITVKLKLTNATDSTIPDLDVTLKKGEDGAWTAAPDKYKLLKNGKEYTITANLTVVDDNTQIVAGNTEANGANGIDATVVNAVKKTAPAADDHTLEELAVEAATDANFMPTPETAKKALADKGVTTTADNDIYYFVEPHLNIMVTGYTNDTNNKTLRIEITAENTIIASTQSNAESIEIGENAAEVTTKPLEVKEPIKLKVGVPADFFSKTGTTYVQHKDVHYHEANIESDKQSVTFISSDGLSPFVLDANADVVARIGETYYESLQAAVDAANDKDTIILLKACDSATVNKAITLTLEAAQDSSVSITEDTLIAGNGVTKKYDSATHTFTFTKPNTGGSGVNANHKVIVDSSITNGTVTADKSDNVAKGTTVTLTVTPKEGYVLDDLTVKTSSGTVQTTTKVNDTTYTFSMPAADVIVTATFKLAEPEEDTVCKPYSDIVTSGSDGWYHEYVHYMIQNGLMTGVEADKFAPKMNLNRAMVAQILYAKANKPTVTATAKFSDVPADRWFTSAVSWAAENGAVSGYTDGTFKPMQAVTREELAVMLYGKESKPTVTGNELAAFADTSSISSWAQNAMLWVVQKGIMDGDNNNKLNPKATATRAEAATMLYKYFAK